MFPELSVGGYPPRDLVERPAFVRAAKRLLKKNPQAVRDLQATLELLADDAFHSALKTHKLKGDLAESWACSAGYDLRVVTQPRARAPRPLPGPGAYQRYRAGWVECRFPIGDRMPELWHPDTGKIEPLVKPLRRKWLRLRREKGF